MASGVLVPFMSKVMLPSDSFEIKLNTETMTHPTVGPLFGSYKLQLDVFSIPIRLYQAQLHNNKLNIGRNMQNIKLPVIRIKDIPNLDETSDIPIDIQQVNPSSLLAYLGIRGFGQARYGSTKFAARFNAVPYLAYYDIYKNYYANKQEEVGAFIDYATRVNIQVDEIGIRQGNGSISPLPEHIVAYNDRLYIRGKNLNADEIMLDFYTEAGGAGVKTTVAVSKAGILESKVNNGEEITMVYAIIGMYLGQYLQTYNIPTNAIGNPEPEVRFFDLENIDTMRENILSEIKNQSAYTIKNRDPEQWLPPYNNNIADVIWDDPRGAITRSSLPMQGLALKTYQSDKFNNWLSTEWIDGTNGVAEVTAVDVSNGSLKLDTLNLAQKVYNMMNRIAVAGGSYYDWIEAVYDTNGYNQSETPIYCGGLSKEIVFQQVISNAETSDQPLGSLGGRGTQTNKHKGGHIEVKVNEPSYVMGIVSLTPRIDYSQGNEWDVNLMTMDDFHKPNLDGIGFQDLITDGMCAWNTERDSNGVPLYKSVGKLPAWINYMTDVNKTYGHFADQRSEMFMTLNRRYEVEKNGNSLEIKDLTTYIDPSKYNYTFAQVDRSAQNFWVQIDVQIKARRKVSAKQIPNL